MGKRLALLAWIAAGAALAAPDQLGALRHASFAIRDVPPSAAEAQAVAAGERDVASLVDVWLASPEHRRRIHRYFDDLLGTRRDIMLNSAHYTLTKSPAGIYTLPDKAACGAADAVEVEAWWLEPGQTARVCANTVSSQLRFPSGRSFVVCPNRPGDWGMGDPRCGCGPRMIGCIPKEALLPLYDAALFEFATRGLNTYEKGGSWTDLVGGDTFYGSRPLYWRYLFQQTVHLRGFLPTSADLASLASLPMEGFGEAKFPGPPGELAATLTSPGFMNQYANFRSRTRGAVEALLCRKIDSDLNTHGLTGYVNPSLGREVEHAERSDCAACHLSLDNLGSMLLGFDDDGLSDPAKRPRTTGAAFGVDAEGPGGFGKVLVEHAPWFHECMAKRAVESFLGVPFESADAGLRTAAINDAAKGPRALIQGILRSSSLLGSRPARVASVKLDAGGPIPALPSVGDTDDTPAPSVERPTFAAANAVLKKGCDGSTCHGPGSSLGVFLDREAFVKSKASAIADRIKRTSAGRMPPPSSGRALTDVERQLLLDYLAP